MMRINIKPAYFQKVLEAGCEGDLYSYKIGRKHQDQTKDRCKLIELWLERDPFSELGDFPDVPAEWIKNFTILEYKSHDENLLPRGKYPTSEGVTVTHTDAADGNRREIEVIGPTKEAVIEAYKKFLRKELTAEELLEPTLRYQYSSSAHFFLGFGCMLLIAVVLFLFLFPRNTPSPKLTAQHSGQTSQEIAKPEKQEKKFDQAKLADLVENHLRYKDALRTYLSVVDQMTKEIERLEKPHVIQSEEEYAALQAKIRYQEQFIKPFRKDIDEGVDELTLEAAIPLPDVWFPIKTKDHGWIAVAKATEYVCDKLSGWSPGGAVKTYGLILQPYDGKNAASLPLIEPEKRADADKRCKER